MPKMMVELLAYWKGKFRQNRNGVIWMIVSHCLMWCIWLERNNRHFEDLEKSLSDVKLLSLKTLLHWVALLGFRSFFSIHGFMDLCTLCT